ncbi:MAG: hypothetical protein QY318_02190 [Candidatus Dojkabacteria bacterium]|nr:MAG: hypothetical protein QY318_02190 [Candidatus Dojkabacteria bacterium]
MATETKAKTEKTKSSSNKAKTEISELAKILSGEAALEKKNAEIERLKKEAVQKQKAKQRSQVKSGELILDPEQYVNPISSPEKVVQKIELYSWEAPIRTKFVFDKRLFLVVVAIALGFVLYLAVLGQYGLMFAIIALLFFIYVAGTTEPINVEHSITTRGIDTMDKLYEWYMLENFWFTNKNGQYMLIVSTRLRMPPNLIMLANREEMSAIFVLLQDRLLYRDVRKQGSIERTTYGEYIPMEKI